MWIGFGVLGREDELPFVVASRVWIGFGVLSREDELPKGQIDLQLVKATQTM